MSCSEEKNLARVKNSSCYNATAGIWTSGLPHSMNMGTEVPHSYPLVHRGGSDLSLLLLLICLRIFLEKWGYDVLVGMLISLWSMLLGDGLEVCSLPSGYDLLVFFSVSGRLGGWADNVPGRTLVDSVGIVLGVTSQWGSLCKSRWWSLVCIDRLKLIRDESANKMVECAWGMFVIFDDV